MKKGVSIMKKKRNLASFFAGVMTVLLAFGCLTSAMAASGEVTYNFANVTLNGEKTNYLPIRAISELLGISIDYDSATRTVLLDSQDEGDWVADGYNGYVVDPNGEKTEVPHLSD